MINEKEKEDEERRTPLSGKACGIISYHRQGVYRDHQSPVDLNLPKGTEHFMSDLHGEYEAFSHVLRNGSGAVRKKINDVFGHTLSNSDKRALATLIYYPREKIQLVKKTEEDMEKLV